MGALAEGPADRPGRMSEPETIISHAARLMAAHGALAGKRIVITAGPTREPIDPVRVITNRSSGRMGFRLAEAAWERGAEVTLISGPTTLAAPVGVTMVRIETTEEMEAEVRRTLPGSDALIMAAAPADFRPASPNERKRPREEGDLSIAMAPTADILRPDRRGPKARGASSWALLWKPVTPSPRGKAKLARKQLDMIVVNDALEPGAGFEVETNRVVILARDGSEQAIPLGVEAGDRRPNP